MERRISGNATVKGSIDNNGTISPGNSIGTVFTTNLILSSTSFYTVEINPTDSNLINASGAVTLGGVVQVVQDPGSYSTQGRYTILTATGGLSGSIDSLEVQGLPGFQFSLEQDNFNLYLSYYFLLPPTNLEGKQCVNQFYTQESFVNVLRWDPPTSGPAPIAYNVYRNDLKTLIGVVPANGKLNFQDHVLSKRNAYTYYIESIDQQNRVSFPAQITINSRR